MTASDISLDLAALSSAYEKGRLRPSETVRVVLDRINAAGDDRVWITRIDAAALLRRAAELEALSPGARRALPLYGIPFAVKDNIDVAGLPTTAACPDYAYTAGADAEVVRRLIAAGGILVGKTNMDQFATGLVGVRSPYGVARNPFDPAYIPGGSSSGSAVAVSAGLVSFSLGTDTAGSGRVPAGFTNIVGLKPTKGLVSTSGVVPACRSLDCVSVFALTAEDSLHVLGVLAGSDAADPFSRAAAVEPVAPSGGGVLGVPAPDHLRFFGDAAAERLYGEAVERARAQGWTVTEIDFTPFAEAADLLYSGPWVAERTAAVGDFIADGPEAVLEVTRTIIMGGMGRSAVEAFRAAYRLEELRKAADRQWERMDALLLPTSGTIYRIEEVLADPVVTNTNLGAYTNFVNLLDLCAVAVPSGFRPDGLPFGVTVMAPAFRERLAAEIAARLHRAAGLRLGATGAAHPPAVPMTYGEDRLIRLLVVGGHLSGHPLNIQLTELGAALAGVVRTAPRYGFYALPGEPRRPGLVRLASGGVSVEGEVWLLTPSAFGRFVAAVPAPLGIGRVELEDGSSVPGFLCEAAAVGGCEDISRYGGWRSFIAAADG